MNTKLKKVLIIIIIILIVVLIGLLIYSLFIKKPESTTIKPGDFPESEEGDIILNEEDLIPDPETKIGAISREAVLSPTLNSDKNGVIYYVKSNGTIWQSDFDGLNLIQVSEAELTNLVHISWSPNKNKVISFFEDSIGNVVKYFHNHETNEAIPLNKYINQIAWSTDGDKIAYQYQNDFTNENNINTANPDGSKYLTILTTRMKDLAIDWPKGSEVFLREKPSGLAQSSLFSINTLNGSFTELINNIYGFSIKWSSDGKNILYSETNDKGKNINIFIANRSGSNKKSANVSTLAEKCVWSQDPRTIYCAVPININNTNILPDDFYKGTFSGDDEFYKINTDTGEKTKILEDSEMVEIYDAVDLFLSLEENYLMFINKNNDFLYSIKLD